MTTGGTGVERRRNYFPLIVTILILAAVGAFIFQNTEDVEVDWLMISISMPIWLLIVIGLVLGAVIGLVWRQRRVAARRAAAAS